jgi:hypothetical protein
MRYTPTLAIAVNMDTFNGIAYRPYTGETDLPAIMTLVQDALSEPYVIYTYRYFLSSWWVSPLHSWQYTFELSQYLRPHLAFMVCASRSFQLPCTD